MHNNHTNFHREEKCLNCDVPLIGSFCSNCGQKAFLHKDSFWHMLLHFIGDYFHYDGKFLKTIKAMIFWPGAVTLDFINGKRAKYLNPIQLYFFVSTMFFLFVITEIKNETKLDNVNIKITYKENENKKADSLLENKSKKTNLIGYNTTSKQKFGIGKWTPTDTSFVVYEKKQQLLSNEAKDSWFKKLTIKQFFKIQSLSLNGGDIEVLYFNTIRKNMPKALFLLLPFFAFLLKIFFRKQNLFYVDHIIHSLHLHSVIFTIICLLTMFCYPTENETIFNVLALIGIASIIIYFTISFKKVYFNSWIKTIFKQILIIGIYLISFFIMLLALLIISFFLL
jgi:Protein of unknown function (DUF3667)